MSSPNKLTLNTNPLQYKRTRSKGVNKISKISKVSKINKIATNDKNTENMEYSPFKMKGPSLYKSPAKDKMSTDMGSQYKSHNADYANNPDHLKNMHGKGRSTSIADAEKAAKKTKETKASPAKDTGAEYNEKAKAESKSGRGLSASTIKAHDEGHATKWNPDHSDKIATKDTKDTKASPAKHTMKNKSNPYSFSHNKRHADGEMGSDHKKTKKKEDPRKVHGNLTAEEAKMMKKASPAKNYKKGYYK